MDNKELKVIADAMLEKKGQDVVSLDLKPIGTAISDYFIVCNADATANVVAIADNIEERMIEKGDQDSGKGKCILGYPRFR